MKSFNILLVLFFGVLTLSNCASLKPYQPTQFQGTHINQENIDQLQIGYNKQQVAYLLGEPALTNALNHNVWQYIYTKKSQEKLSIKQKLTLTFDENGLLSQIDQE